MIKNFLKSLKYILLSAQMFDKQINQYKQISKEPALPSYAYINWGIYLIRNGKSQKGIEKFNQNVFTEINDKWGIITAGDKTVGFNGMTVSWGGFGIMWNKPVAFIFVRKSRYTHEFMDREEYFTLSFYPEEYRKILGVLGSKSGRDMDKMNGSGLTAKEVPNSMTFEEAEITIVCRKMFMQRLEPSNISDLNAAKFYTGDAVHDMYIGEVVDIIRR